VVESACAFAIYAVPPLAPSGDAFGSTLRSTTMIGKPSRITAVPISELFRFPA
jgi:hypothetical protein